MKLGKKSIAKLLLLAVIVALTLPALRQTMMASAEDVQLSIDRTCSPETFRPDEWVVVECIVHLTNNGQTPLSNTTSGYKSASGVIPRHFFMLYEINGVKFPIEPTTLSFGGEGTLQPGQTAEVRLLVLLKMDREGVYNGEWPTRVDGEELPTPPLRYEADSGAAEPPRDLLVKREIVAQGGKVYYRTTVTNQGSTPITELSLTERYNKEAVLFEAANPDDPSMSPEPVAKQPNVQIEKWDLASLGKESLAPGESLALDTGYVAASSNDCVSVQSAMMVEATVDGETQRYGARAEDVEVGACHTPTGADTSPGRGGGDQPVVGVPALLPPGAQSAPATGEGTFRSSDFSKTPMMALLTFAAGLVAAGVVIRRGVRG